MNVYEKYGKLIVQLEILNGQIQECKKQIAQFLNQSVVKEEPVKE